MINPVRIGGAELWLEDCREVLPLLSAGSVDAILTDPPYFMVKDEEWDNQWPSADAYLAWLDNILAEFSRLLPSRGSLFLFASPRMAARVECLVAGHFEVLNRITWRKPAFGTKAEMFRKADLRSFFPASEAIIFAQHHRDDGKCPLGVALAEARTRAGLSTEEAARRLGRVGRDGKGTGVVRNWEAGIRLPSKDDFVRALVLCGDDRSKIELGNLYIALHRPFVLTDRDQYTDVWDFPTVSRSQDKHPCEKPLAMIEHMVRCSTRPGAVVLDAFMGSGTTGLACHRLGRHFVGVESDAGWFARAAERIGAAEKQANFLTDPIAFA